MVSPGSVSKTLEKQSLPQEPTTAELPDEAAIVKSSKSDLDRCFEDDASLLSLWFMTYLNPIFRKGQLQTLKHADLGVVSKHDRAAYLYKKFYARLQIELKKPAGVRSLWAVLWSTVGYNNLFYAIFLYALYSATSFGPILVLNALVQHFQGTKTLSPTALWFFVALNFFLPMFGSIVAARSNAILAHIGLQFRNALINSIYRKALVLSPAAKQLSSTGQIINMFSTDTAQIQRFLFFFNNLFLALPTIGVSLYLIYREVGVATFVGLGMSEPLT